MNYLKSISFVLKCITFLGFISNTYGNCGFGGIFVVPLTKTVNHCSYRKSPSCTEWLVGPISTPKTIVLFLSNIAINCAQKEDIIIYDEQRVPIYDLCAIKQSNIDYFFMTREAKFLIIRSTLQAEGSIDFTFNFNYYESTFTTMRPTIPTVTNTTKAGGNTTTIKPVNITLPDFFPRRCGLQDIEPNTNNIRIVGGIDAKPHSWPWQVMITDEEKICGGSLITDRWIISAAHCTTAFNLTKFRIHLASSDANRRFEENRIIMKQALIINHPLYKGPRSNYDYDIALIKLERPVNFTDKISPVCLPTANDKPSIGKKGFITGWGDTTFDDGTTKPENTTDQKPFENFLKQASITIMKKSECADFLKIRQICAGETTKPYRDACQGDSGGPFVIRRPNKEFYLSGLVSNGIDCIGYGVYTNILEFMHWIIDTTKANN